MPSTWTRGSREQTTSNPVPRAGPGAPWSRGLDPYFLWARHTGWRGFTVHAGWDRVDPNSADIQIIARAKNQAMLDAALKSGWINVSTVYERPAPGALARALHFTGKVNRRDEAKLFENNIGLRWELAVPLRDAERVALGSAQGVNGPSRSLTDFRATNLVADAIRRAWPLDHPVKLPGAIAVIDFGCPFLRHSLVITNPGGNRPIARVAALWDQGSQPRTVTPQNKSPGKDEFTPAAFADDTWTPEEAKSWPWLKPSQFNYGRELGPKALKAMVRRSRSVKHMLDERAIYRGIDYLIDYNDARRRIWFATHGSHILDMAAGSVDPLQPTESPEHDHAACAPIIFVQLPSLTAADSSGGALSAHVLDGVRYALDLCESDTPLAINISYGTFAGPHDGSSLVESALTELLGMARKNLAIVLAAGNARAERCHARRMANADASALLRCKLPDGDTNDTFVEIWYDAPKEGAELQVRARPPNRQWSAWLSPDQEDVLKDDARKGACVATLRHDRWVPNGDRSLMLLAVGPTAAPADVPGALADPGLWEIEIQLVGAAAKDLGPIVVDAWIERDDPGWSQPEQRAHFLDQNAEDDANTLSSLATGPLTLVVGAFNLDSGQTAAYSSRGPQRFGVEQRFVLAAAEEDEQQPTITAAAIRSGEVVRLNGTSVAAPVLTRRVFNRMREGPPVPQSDWPSELTKLIAVPPPGPKALKESPAD